MNSRALSVCRIGVSCLSILCSLETAAQMRIVPTTTLSAQTSKNTSTSAAFKSQTNGNAGPGNVSKSSIRNLLYYGSTSKIYASLMPWFGSPSHMSVGCTSSNPQQISAQISDMSSRGIQGVIIPWYGADSYDAATAMNFMPAAQAAGNFEFSLRYEAGAVLAYAQQNGCDVTTQFINDLNYIAGTFYGSSAYTRVHGRPLLYVFGIEEYYVDWSRVSASVAGNPLFMIRNPSAFNDANADGGYSWVEIDPSNPNDRMLSYLEEFYAAAQSSAKYAVGSGYKGFNDSLASWGANRVINQQCGLTWLNTFAEAGKYYSSSHQLNAFQIVTWNDYEEGTEIESGIGNCVALAPSVVGSTLSWSIGSQASESTIDFYQVFISNDGENLMKLADVTAGTHSLDLSQFDLAAQTYVLYVRAVGKASIVNHMSYAVAYNPDHPAPVASLSLSTDSGPAPQVVTASSVNSSDSEGHITAVKFDFGDGTVSSGGAGFAQSHTYQTPGTYTITLTVIDNAGVFASTQQTIDVAAGPGVVITYPTAGATVNSPVEVVATGSIAGGVSSMEVFVDNTNSPAYVTTSASVDAFLQIAAGAHTLRVVAEGAAPATNSVVSEVTFTVGANSAPPVAILTVEPLNGGDEVMACTATSTDSNGSITGSTINFGDGTNAPGPTAFHTYASAGTYHVTATVTNNSGLTSTTSSSVSVGAGTVEGYVTKIGTGIALAGVKISIGGASASANSSGYYSLGNVPAGANVLVASAPGYLARSYNVNIAPGTATSQNVALSTAGVLKGNVTNSSGVGVAGATLSISGGGLSSSFTASTDSKGAFNSGWVPVGAYEVTATSSSYVSKTVSTRVSTGQTTNLAIPLSSDPGH
jgi:PKD repeat protein